MLNNPISENLKKELENIVTPDRVRTRLIDRYAFASDASHFYLVPKAVVQPKNNTEIQALFAFSQQNNIPLTFRAGGTSLSGQAVTDGILVDLSRFWRNINIENEGKTIRLQPAVIGGYVNLALKKWGRKMGPDPASINAAMMGGILSNNSSGMCCGVAQNSYHTLKYITFILPNGLIFNTEKPEDYERFENECTEIAQKLQVLRGEILSNEILKNRIKQKYLQKNTTGYSLNAFLDFEKSLDILAHLLIGAEGTLAFIAEAVLQTLPDLPFKMTGMLYFETVEAACNAIFALRQTGAEALELMDRAALRSVEHQKGVPDFVKNLPSQAAAILCEFHASTEGSLLEKFNLALPIISKLDLLHQPNFTQNPNEQAAMWKIRKGMYPSVASVRAKGTATMLEDLTFPIEHLGAAISDVQALFKQYNYTDGIIFGHAKDGNLHFCISQNFSESIEIERFRKFNDDLFELVLKKYDGALKGEHGTGRAVAPYVEAEWGREGYDIMKKLKSLIDPHFLLNPNVIITKDPNEHLTNLKIMPIVEEEVDKCVECGYCERRCPSRDFTLTPRQRIGIRRALQRLKNDNQDFIYQEILKDYQFDGLDTCAVDGMCATDCPVDINTGELVKRLRRENQTALTQKMALQVAKNFNVLTTSARFGLRLGFAFNQFLGKNFMRNLTAKSRAFSTKIPLWSNELSKGSNFSVTQKIDNQTLKIIYFPSCITQMMGGDLMQRFYSVCQKAKIQVVLPPSLGNNCCGQLFGSKGFSDAHRYKVNETIAELWAVTEGGRFSVVTDVTSCTATLQQCRPYLTAENQLFFDQLKIFDSIDFASDVLLPRLNIGKKKGKIVFHPVCSAYKMGLVEKLRFLGQHCAEKSVIPDMAGCCGMAGDRGFYIPELTQAATKLEATEVKQQDFEGYYSSAKTCEMNFSEAVGKNYQSILVLLDEVSI